MQLSIALAFLTALCFNTFLYAAGDDDDDKQAPPNKPPTSINDAKDTALQNNGGIITQALEPAGSPPEFSAYGTVVSLEPLLALRQQYLAAQAQQDSAEAKYHEADLNLNRTLDLHRHDIVSTRRLQEQQAQWRNDKAGLAASSYQQQTLLAASRLQWGDSLTGWFTQIRNNQAEQFLNHRAQLLEIRLPANTSLEPEIRNIEVDPHGRRNEAVTATLISSAPQVDPVTQGKRYFFKIAGDNLPFGAHVSAWIPSGKAENPGVIIPEKAVVWHLGQAIVFIKTKNGEFSRRILPEQIQAKGGYFAASGFKSGEEIVTTGAQTLLSQELKNLIPNEDDD